MSSEINIKWIMNIKYRIKIITKNPNMKKFAQNLFNVQNLLFVHYHVKNANLVNYDINLNFLYIDYLFIYLKY